MINVNLPVALADFGTDAQSLPSKSLPSQTNQISIGLPDHSQRGVVVIEN